MSAVALACGLKSAPAWALPANLFVAAAALRSVTSLDGLRAPWANLTPYLGAMQLTTVWAGGVYIASGVVAARQGHAPSG